MQPENRMFNWDVDRVKKIKINVLVVNGSVNNLFNNLLTDE